MLTVNLSEAQAHLRDILSTLNPGEGLILVEEGEEIATLIKAPIKQWPCKAGSAKDTPHWMADDFDAPLEEFRDYME